ncbi:MAG: hypothetical protein D6785_14015, partial [Planctomycetota bacterium]
TVKKKENSKSKEPKKEPVKKTNPDKKKVNNNKEPAQKAPSDGKKIQKKKKALTLASITLKDLEKAAKSLREEADKVLKPIREKALEYYKRPRDETYQLESYFKKLVKKAKILEYGRERMTDRELLHHPFLRNFNDLYNKFWVLKKNEVTKILETDRRIGKYIIHVIEKTKEKAYPFPHADETNAERKKLREKVEADFLFDKALEKAKDLAEEAHKKALKGEALSAIAKKVGADYELTKILKKDKFEKMSADSPYPYPVIQKLLTQLGFPGDISEVFEGEDNRWKGERKESVFLVKYLYYQDAPASEFGKYIPKLKESLLLQHKEKYLKNMILELKIKAFSDVVSEEQLHSYYSLIFLKKKGEEIPAPLATLPGGAEIYGELFRPVSSAKVRRLVWDYEDSLQEAAWKKAKEESHGFYKDVRKGIHWNELVMSQRAGILPLLGFAPIQLDSYIQKKG